MSPTSPINNPHALPAQSTLDPKLLEGVLLSLAHQVAQVSTYFLLLLRVLALCLISSLYFPEQCGSHSNTISSWRIRKLGRATYAFSRRGPQWCHFESYYTYECKYAMKLQFLSYHFQYDTNSKILIFQNLPTPSSGGSTPLAQLHQQVQGQHNLPPQRMPDTPQEQISVSIIIVLHLPFNTNRSLCDARCLELWMTFISHLISSASWYSTSWSQQQSAYISSKLSCAWSDTTSTATNSTTATKCRFGLSYEQ